jgi:protocatechuate 3,4-dioxygenase beta subunit
MKFPRFLTRLNRRKLLHLIGGTAAVTLVGCVRETSGATESPIASSSTNSASAPSQSALQTAQSTPGCIVRPQQTEGPYFVDERLNRSDIRSNPDDGAVKPGVPLRLVFRVSQVAGSACQPLSGAMVDIWHCDAAGVYSDVQETQGQKFLRGYQMTDGSGTAQFVTLYPGWYSGRATHIHFKIRGSSAERPDYEFTSQIYFDDAVTDRVYAQAPYAARGARSVRNDQDGIFRRGGDRLIVPVRQSGEGYEGQFDIGLELA